MTQRLSSVQSSLRGWLRRPLCWHPLSLPTPVSFPPFRGRSPSSPLRIFPLLSPYVLSKESAGTLHPSVSQWLGVHLIPAGGRLTPADMGWVFGPKYGSSLVRKKICNGMSSSLAPGHTLLTRPQKSRQAPAQQGGPGKLETTRRDGLGPSQYFLSWKEYLKMMPFSLHARSTQIAF